jgi:hypothetical protein
MTKLLMKKPINLVIRERMYQNLSEIWLIDRYSCINGVKSSRNLEKKVFLGKAI